MKKILYGIAILISLFTFNISVNAQENLVKTYKLNCNDLRKYEDLLIEKDMGNIEIQIYQNSNTSEYSMKVNGSYFPQTKKTWADGEGGRYLYDTSDFKSVFCGQQWAYSDSMTVNRLIFDYLYADIEKLATTDYNLKVFKINDEYSRYNDIVLIPYTSSYISGGKIKIDYPEEDISYKIESMETLPTEIIDEAEASKDLFTCYYKHDDGGIKYYLNLEYNTKEEKMVIPDNPYVTYGVWADIWLENQIFESIKSGKCPDVVYILNPKADGTESSDYKKMLITSDFIESNKFRSHKYVSSTFGGEIIGDSGDYVNSNRYKQLLGDLKNPLNALDSKALSYSLKLDGKDITLNDIDATDGVCSTCDSPKYQTETALRNVKSYCNDLRKLDKKQYSAVDFKNRTEECDSFDKFYDKLVAEGIISNLASGCGIISSDLKDKLNFYLNIIKIAGPIIAIVLGMMDFVKVLAVGDADKEMKAATKKLTTRLIAAVLLILVPTLLSMLMNFILVGDHELEDDPFCEIIE